MCNLLSIHNMYVLNYLLLSITAYYYLSNNGNEFAQMDYQPGYQEGILSPLLYANTQFQV